MMKEMFFIPHARPGTCRPTGALYSMGLYGSTDITALRAGRNKITNPMPLREKFMEIYDKGGQGGN
jgi:hypothetical protein